MRKCDRIMSRHAISVFVLFQSFRLCIGILFVLSPLSAASANPKWDVAWTRVKTGTKISCKIQAPSGGGKWASATIAGIRKPPPYGKQYGDDIPFTIFKFGQTTLGTKGQVISFYPMAKAAGTALNWGYRTVATWPDLPHDMTLFPTWRIDNLGAVRGSATPVPTTRALALDEGWEPRVMSYHGNTCALSCASYVSVNFQVFVCR